MNNQINILVVDDEQIVLNSIRKHLKSDDNYKIDYVQSAEEGLLLMEKERYHIILTDLMMPEIDGLEFLKITKEKEPSTLVIMITGYATINTALQAMQLGAFDYLAKPFTRDEVQKLVYRATEIVKAGMENGDKLTGSETEKDKFLNLIKGIGKHSWIVREDSGNVLIGVERPFLYGIGKIQTVYLPAKGDYLNQGSLYFQVFSSDLRSQSLMSPLSGTVVEINQKVLDNPQEAFLDPYGEGWLLRLAPSNFEEEVKILWS